VLWCPCGVFNSTTPPQIRTCPSCRCWRRFPEAGAAQPAVGTLDAAAGPRTPVAAAAGTFAVGASASTTAAGAAVASCAPGPNTFHDPCGHGPHNSFPPVYYEYPSLCTVFSQRISDLIGRSRKEDASAILKEFDKSTKRAQEYARKASEYTTRSRDLMASSHQECVISMNKLLADAAAAKQASKGRRRKATNVTQPATNMSFFFYFFTIMLLSHVSRSCNHTHNLFANIHLITSFFVPLQENQTVLWSSIKNEFFLQIHTNICCNHM
jgi:hypothetical protein